MLFLNPIHKFKQVVNLLEQNDDEDNDYLRTLPEPKSDVQYAETEEGTDFPFIDYQEFDDIVKTNYDLKIPALFSGPPGVGKTEVIETTSEQIAQSLGKKFVNFKEINETNINHYIENIQDYFIFMDIRVASLEPSDMQGIPNIRDKRDFLIFKIPAWAYICTLPNSQGILFFDEINQGRPDVLNTLFSVSHPKERKVGAPPRKLGDGWAVFAAGNFGMYGNEPLKQALISRYETYSVRPDAESWVQWAKTRTPPIYKHIWKFVSSNPARYFYKVPEAGSEKQFPSPRSFEKLSKSLYELEARCKKVQEQNGQPIPNIYDMITKRAMANCGKEWGLSFRHYLLVMRDITLEKIAKGKLLSRDKSEDPYSMDKAYAYIQYLTDEVARVYLKSLKYKTPEVQQEFKKALELLVEILREVDDEDFLSVINTKLWNAGKIKSDPKIPSDLYKVLIQTAASMPGMKQTLEKIRSAVNTMQQGYQDLKQKK